jgi:hypothetical protein
LDGLPVDLKESGLARDSGMIVLRQRHKGLTWKAADAIVDPLFKLLDPDAKGYISSSKFKEFFLHRLHPDLQRNAHAAHSSGSALRVHHGTGTSNQHSTWDFNRVVQGARQKYQQRQAARRSSGCFVAGTQVLTPSGSQVSIERLRLGDAVMAFDCEGMLQPASVRGCMSFLSEKHYIVTLSNGGIMRVTGQHPICVAPDTFCRADALLVGHRVMVRTSEFDSLVDAVVTHFEAVSDSTVVYNLSTTPHHTFFASDAAVHNKGGGCFSGIVPVMVILKNSDRRRVCMSQLRPGDVIEGALLICCVFLQ